MKIAGDLALFQTRLGYRFKQPSGLIEAVTHASKGTSTRRDYQRLEFLGDRVLGLLLADHFYAAFPQDDEGALSLRLHGEARMSTLAAIAKNLQLAEYIKSQSGLDIAGNDGVMADVVESLHHCPIKPPFRCKNARRINKNHLHILMHGNAPNTASGGLHLWRYDRHFMTDHRIHQS